MFPNNYFANRYFAPVYFASIGATPTPGGLTMIYYRRVNFTDQWSLDGVTWVDGPLERALFQFSILSTLNGPLEVSDLVHLNYQWYLET